MPLLNDFPDCYYYEVPDASGKPRYKLAYPLPDGTRTSRLFTSMQELLVFAAKTCVAIATAKQEQIAPPEKPLLETLLAEFPRVMARKARILGPSGLTTHMKASIARLRRMFQALGWVFWQDINADDLDKFFQNRVPTIVGSCKQRKRQKSLITPSMRAFYTLTLQTFVRRFAFQGLPCHRAILEYPVPKIDNVGRHVAWPIEEDSKWTQYLAQGAEVLIDCDPSWSLYERLNYRPLDNDLRERLTLLVIHLLRGRYAWRATEVARLNCGHWNFHDRRMVPDFLVVKSQVKMSLMDAETGWLLDVCSVNRGPTEPLIQALRGGRWFHNYIGEYTQKHLAKAGLGHRLPYDVKYTRLTHIFEHPELYVDPEFDERLKRAKSVAGHAEHSEEIKKYVRARWGSQYNPAIRNFYNAQKFLPFDVSQHAVVRIMKAA